MRIPAALLVLVFCAACTQSTPSTAQQSAPAATPASAPAITPIGALVPTVRKDIAADDLATADRRVQGYRQAYGENSELALAISWMARGALAAKKFNAAEEYAEQSRQMVLKLVQTGPLDREPSLPLALGNAMEAHVGVLKASAASSEAMKFLRTYLKTYGDTSMGERIRKNIHILSLDGKPAPPLDEKVWFGPKPPGLTALHGKVVLLFFWAHWCPDCKAEVPVLAGLKQTYGDQLALIGPTKYYGYVANGEDAPPTVEKAYIEQIRRQYYAPLADMPAPLSNMNFEVYGASTTPTLALLDRQGRVAWYHPGAASGREIGSEIEALLR